MVFVEPRETRLYAPHPGYLVLPRSRVVLCGFVFPNWVQFLSKPTPEVAAVPGPRGTRAARAGATAGAVSGSVDLADHQCQLRRLGRGRSSWGEPRLGWEVDGVG